MPFPQSFQGPTTPIPAAVKVVTRVTPSSLTPSDRGSLIELNSTTATQTFNPAAQMGDGWYCWLRNNGEPTQGTETVYANTSLNVTANEPDPQWLMQGKAGTRLYVVGPALGTMGIYQYNLSTPYVLTGASYQFVNNTTYSVTGNTPYMGISQDGTRLLVPHSNNRVYQFNFGTAWEINTLSNPSISYDHSAQIGSGCRGAAMSADGTRMYLMTNSGGFYRYTLSTPYNVSTAVYHSTTGGGGAPASDWHNLTISADGLNFYAYSLSTRQILHWTLTTAWDLATLTYAGSMSFAKQVISTVGGAQMADNGSAAYGCVAGSLGTVYQYTPPAPNRLQLPGDAAEITLDPSGLERIDGLTSYVMHPKECRLIQCDGTKFTSVVINPFYKQIYASQNFIVPPGYNNIGGIAWGGGQAGQSTSSSSAGGSGGGAAPVLVSSPTPGAVLPVVIGAGGRYAGAGGGTTTFSGVAVTGGQSFGGSLIGSLFAPTSPVGLGFETNNGSGTPTANFTVWAGLSSTTTRTVSGGTSIYGGGCGGSFVTSAGYSAGTSAYGGSGGAGGNGQNAGDGAAPGGGGGGVVTNHAFGFGARGEVRLWGVA